MQDSSFYKSYVFIFIMATPMYGKDSSYLRYVLRSYLEDLANAGIELIKFTRPAEINVARGVEKSEIYIVPSVPFLVRLIPGAFRGHRISFYNPSTNKIQSKPCEETGCLPNSHRLNLNNGLAYYIFFETPKRGKIAELLRKEGEVFRLDEIWNENQQSNRSTR